MTKTLIILVGPTGIGKSDLSIKLAQHFNTEIVSCDSRQFFKELTIGTAVPPKEDLRAVQHHLIHSHSIHENYNVSTFEHQALDILKELFEQHNVVVMTGGSMLYIDAICKGIDIIPDADPEIRARLGKQLQEEGLQALVEQLKELDPCYYNQVDLKNPKRVLHGVEMCLTLNKPYSSMRTNPQRKRPFNIVKLGLTMEREQLYKRINSRVDVMMQRGLEEEAKRMLEYADLNALNTVGYKELFAYFRGEIDKDRAVELIKRNTRHYAKKQLTWFRKDEQIKWFAPSEYDNMLSYLASLDIN